MHLGTMIALTWPSLLQVATASIVEYQEQDPDMAKREELAYKWYSSQKFLTMFNLRIHVAVRSSEGI